MQPLTQLDLSNIGKCYEAINDVVVVLPCHVKIEIFR